MLAKEEKSCEDRIDYMLASTTEDLENLVKEEDINDAINGYFLGFDFVEAGTFENQKEAYFRLQMSWGGPSDEFRVFTNPDYSIHRIEYHFQDWFDGAVRDVTNNETIFDFIEQSFQYDFEYIANKNN